MFNTLTMWHNCHYRPSPQLFSSCKTETLSPLNTGSPPSLSEALQTTTALSVSRSLQLQRLQIRRRHHSNSSKRRGTKSLLRKLREEREKACLTLNSQKTRIMASGPITSRQIDGKQWKQCQTLFWGAQKSLQMVIAAMKLKDTYSLERKL